LIDPAFDLHQRGKLAYLLLLGVRVRQGFEKVGGIALSQIDDGIHACGFEQVGVLLPDTLDPEQVGVVHPFQDQFVADPGFFFDLLAAFGGCPGLQEVFNRAYSSVIELLSLLLANSFYFD
jgi:hypothetical protein